MFNCSVLNDKKKIQILMGNGVKEIKNEKLWAFFEKGKKIDLLLKKLMRVMEKTSNCFHILNELFFGNWQPSTVCGRKKKHMFFLVMSSLNLMCAYI